MKPEEAVRQKVIAKLLALGWHESHLRWKPEWAVPDTPHDLTKREKGQKYAVCGFADLVAFADNSAQWYALTVIFEFKAPDIVQGKSQLLRYLSNEPMAKMGFWTNGEKSLAVYKRHGSDWEFIENATLPHPTDDLTQPPIAPPTWDSLQTPSEIELSGALKRLVATTVVSDPNVTRREDQLRELIHILLVKLESDAVASRSGNVKKVVAFRIYGDSTHKIKLTADRIRELFKEYYTKQRTRIFNPADRELLFLSDETIFAIVAELVDRT